MRESKNTENIIYMRKVFILKKKHKGKHLLSIGEKIFTGNIVDEKLLFLVIVKLLLKLIVLKKRSSIFTCIDLMQRKK